MKVCTRCKESKDESEFWNRKKSPDGLDSACTECKRNYHRELYKNPKRKKQIRTNNSAMVARRQQQIKEILHESGCVDCPVKDWRVLEFDHLRDKEFNIGEAIRRGISWKRMLEEIAKCDIVCANCHKLRTYARIDTYRNNPYDPAGEGTDLIRQHC